MKLKVAHCDVTVLPLPERHAIDAECFGIWHPDARTISIQETLAPPEQARVLLHELVHAIYSCFRLVEKDRSEEGVCMALDVPLATVFRDNPHLLVSLGDALRNGRPIVRPSAVARKASRR